MASFFFPNGFIAAIGFAGLVMFVGFFLIPFLMVWKKRASHTEVDYRLSGGKMVLFFVLVVSTIAAACKVLGMLGYLPSL